MTYIGSARLEADDLDPWTLTIENGFAVDSLDLGYPAIRGVMSPNPDHDGEDDRTRYFGARAVVLGGTVVPVRGMDPMSRQAVLDRLGAFLSPARRPWLYYELEPGSGERRLRLRGDQHSRPILHPGSAKVSAGWRAPDGIQESGDEISVALTGWHHDEHGREYDLVFDRTYPEQDVLGLGELTLPGTLPAAPIITITGPCLNPRIENKTTGRRMEFDLYIPAGRSIIIDVRERTVVDNFGGNRFSTRDPARSSWWTLVPGLNVLRYFPEGADVGTTATVRARGSWI